MLEPGGKVIDIVPSFAKVARSLLPGPYTVFTGRPDSDDLQHVADAAGRGDLATRIHSTVPLAEAIPALIDLEKAPASGPGKLVITTD